MDGGARSSFFVNGIKLGPKGHIIFNSEHCHPLPPQKKIYHNFRPEKLFGGQNVHCLVALIFNLILHAQETKKLVRLDCTKNQYPLKESGFKKHFSGPNRKRFGCFEKCMPARLYLYAEFWIPYPTCRSLVACKIRRVFRG